MDQCPWDGREEKMQITAGALALEGKNNSSTKVEKKN